MEARVVKTSRYVALGAILFTSLALPTSAFAQKYGSFDNSGAHGVGDCQYEADANLTLHEFPSTAITTSEVLNAWRTNGVDLQSNGLWAGLDFLEEGGFGHSASITQAYTRTAQIFGANHGGLWVYVESMPHAIGIIRANPRYVVSVDDGVISTMTWHAFNFEYRNDTYYAVTWAPTPS